MLLNVCSDSVTVTEVFGDDIREIKPTYLFGNAFAFAAPTRRILNYSAYRAWMWMIF